jgi:hypothetical protein
MKYNFKAEGKLKDVCTANNAYLSEHWDKGLYNSKYLVKYTTENLHCKQLYDLPQL